MSIHYSPTTVTNGLVLSLDAGNSKSYPGSGTTWTDLSGRGNTGTLIAGSTFDSANGGTIKFNSTSYATVSGLSSFNFGSAITLNFWHYNSSVNAINYRGVIANTYGSGTGFDFRYGRENYYGGTNNGTALYAMITTNVGSYGFAIFSDLDSWGYYTEIYDGSTLSAFKNGILFSSVSASGSLGSNSNSTIIGANANLGERLNGSLGNASIYNRALSAAEIYQNFNALRGRYGV